MRNDELMSSSSPMPAGIAAADDAHKLVGDLVNMSDIISGNCKPGSIVSVMGCVKSVKMPFKGPRARGTTIRCSASLLSLQPVFWLVYCTS